MTVIERVSSEGVRARRLVALTAIAGGVAGAVALLTLGAILLGGGRWLSLPVWLPFVWWAMAVGLTVLAAWRVPRQLAARVTDEALALTTEYERGLRSGALVGLVQLSAGGGALVRHQAAYLSGVLGPGMLAPRHAKRLAFAALGAMVATLLAGLGTWSSAASRGDGWRALVHPIAAARGSLLEPLSLAETPASIVRGDSLAAVVLASGRRHVVLSWRVTGSGWRDTSLSVADGRAVLALGSVDAPVALVANDGRSRSDSLDVKVFERPFAGDVAVRAVYPAYLGRAADVLAPDDVLRIPEGTNVEVMARAAGLERLALASERDTVTLALAAGRARGHVVARTSGTWRWISTTTGADLPASLAFDVIPDSAPRVEVVSPTRDTLVSPGDAVRLLVAATDDHGLRDVRLHVWSERANGARDGDHTTALADVSGSRWLGELRLDLAPGKLSPGDAMILVAEARDAAPFGRVGTSRRLELRVPTADMRRDVAMSAADSIVARAAAAAVAQKSLEKRTADAARASGARSDESKGTQRGSAKDGAASFESQERARELVADQKALGERIQELSKEADRLAKELQKAGVMDSSISAELKEAQRLLREAMTPEMQKQLRDLEAQRQQMTGDELQDALNKLQDPQQNMREAMEKAKEMLARAALEGRMQSVTDAAKEAAQQQKQFADSGKAGERPGAAKELAERAKAVQNEAQKLAERLNKEQAQAAKQGVQQAAQQAAESAKQMQDAAQQAAEAMGQQTAKLGQGQQGQQSAQNAAQQAAEAMQKASESLGQAKQAQVNAWKQEITDALDRSIQETQQMARQQEQIGKQAGQGASSQLRAQQGAVQQGVEQTADRLAQQGQKSALISPNSQQAMDAARQSVAQATRELNDGTGGQQAQRSMQDAADALRQAAAAMSRDRERAGNSQTASGLPELMQQMREMAGQQAQLNGAAAQLMPTLQPGGDGAVQKEAVKPLAEKQRQVAQKLEDAADADPTRRAEALAREARQIAQQLERGQLDRSVIDRQSQLFSRMLDAGRTLEQNERDDSNKREAKSGQGIVADAPASGTMRGDPAVKFKEPTWKELSGLTAEDRQLIVEYFRRLNAKKQ